MEFLMDAALADFLGKPVWAWVLFLGVVLGLLALDLGFFHRDNHAITIRESLWMCAGYIVAALLFGAWIWREMGPDSGMDYLTGFFVEKSLALDNIFVISLVFSYFAIPSAYQHRVLFWGILGVIVLRGIMIGLGAALVHEFSWILYFFGAFLVVTGIKMMFVSSEERSIGDNPLIGFLRRRMRVTDELVGHHFFVRRKDPVTGRTVRFATPLFLALVMIECVDVIFAVDSIPAIFAITTDPYIVYTSNIFAILGLRALYMALEVTVKRLVYLKYALAVLLVFIGGKIFWNQLVGKIDPAVSLSVTLAILSAGVVLSLLKTRLSQEKEGG